MGTLHPVTFVETKDGVQQALYTDIDTVVKDLGDSIAYYVTRLMSFSELQEFMNIKELSDAMKRISREIEWVKRQTKSRTENLMSLSETA